MPDALFIHGRTAELEIIAAQLEEAGYETTLLADEDGGGAVTGMRHAYTSVTRCTTPILWVRPDSSLDYANPAACKMLGCTLADIQGRSIPDFDPDWTRDYWENVGYPTIRERGIHTFEARMYHADGTLVPIEVTANHVEIDGEAHVFAFIVDIRDRRAREEALARAMEEIEALRAQLQAENVYLREEIRSSHGFNDIVGSSDSLRAVLHQVEQVAPTDATVLILGETGTGKELVARAIHDRSPRAASPLVKVNCASLPASLIESELFGHEKGAFTGAIARREGRFALADGGTLFLDEIGDLPLDLQAKLLRVLQEGEFEPLGSGRTHKVDVRVIAATNRDMDLAMAEEEFRADLYFRLTVFPVHVPPLRDRVADIPLLTWSFVRRNEPGLHKAIESIPADGMARLQAYSWPGNVRELENVIQRAMILSPGSSLVIPDLGMTASPLSGSPAPASQALDDVERDHIRRVLQSCQWRIKGEGGAAERLGLAPSTLRYRLKKLGITRP